VRRAPGRRSRPCPAHQARKWRKSESVCSRECPLEAHQVGGYGQAQQISVRNPAIGWYGHQFGEVRHDLTAGLPLAEVKPPNPHRVRRDWKLRGAGLPVAATEVSDPPSLPWDANPVCPITSFHGLEVHILVGGAA
jgi:hypothetical protein